MTIGTDKKIKMFPKPNYAAKSFAVLLLLQFWQNLIYFENVNFHKVAPGLTNLNGPFVNLYRCYNPIFRKGTSRYIDRLICRYIDRLIGRYIDRLKAT